MDRVRGERVTESESFVDEVWSGMAKGYSLFDPSGMIRLSRISIDGYRREEVLGDDGDCEWPIRE